jgi:N-acetylglucosaminyl-diphospho-decaprenol L-rhamnosyltransferase
MKRHLQEPLAKQLDELTVVLVTFNSAHCVQALADNLHVFPNIYVVDNASEDDTLLLLRALLPHAQIFAQHANIGFGRANNVALRNIKTTFALLLNPDCHISVDAVNTLIESANTFPDAAILAPQVIRPDGSIEVSYRWPSLSWKSHGPAASAPCCVGFTTGAVLLLRHSLFTTEQFFDEDFFLYYEDEDLCLRTFQRGQSIIVIPQAKATHASRGSVRGKTPWQHEYARGYHHVQSKLLFISKHRSKAAADSKRHQLLLLACLALPLRLLLPSPRLIARFWGRCRGLLAYTSTSH